MIAASRRLPPTTCNKLHSKFSSFGTTTYSAMPTPGSPLRTDTPSHQSFEWSSNLFSGENKERTISLLSTDRDNSAFNFKKFGKDCRPAAVLVPFCYDIQGRPGILYNLRSETLSTHKGEISFPGLNYNFPLQDFTNFRKSKYTQYDEINDLYFEIRWNV